MIGFIIVRIAGGVILVQTKRWRNVLDVKTSTVGINLP
jgi:hypothetical protein